MRLLITGTSGQLGRALLRQLSARGFDCIAPARSQLDLADPGLQLPDCDAILNAAAYTAVDRAEHDREAANAVNHLGAARLAESCAQRNIPLFHFSSDYVFAGTALRPYQESDSPGPLNVYGQTKLAGEEAIRRLQPRHLILRLSWVFSEHGTNFFRTILRLARERERLRVVCDQQGGPTYAAHVALVVEALVERCGAGQLRWGTYHYCDGPAASWYELACWVVGQARAQGFPVATRVVEPIASADYPAAARRPAYSVLDCSKLEEELGAVQRFWKEGAQRALLELRAQESL